MRQAVFGTAKRTSLGRTRSTARQTARWSFRYRETSYWAIRSSSFCVGTEISEQSASTQANFKGHTREVRRWNGAVFLRERRSEPSTPVGTVFRAIHHYRFIRAGEDVPLT